MDLIDSHCHLHFSEYDTDLPEVISASASAGVTRIVNVGTTLTDSQKAIELASQQTGMWASVGVHPNDAGNLANDPSELEELKSLLKQPKVVAVGEIGLDFYHNRTPRDVQEKILRLQLEAGLEAGLPFIFHIRESFGSFWPIFDSYHPNSQPIKGVIHSFSAPPSELEQVIKRGLFIGLNGLITYAKDESWRESALLAPLDRILLETDAPFLAPAPDRQARCEPKHTKVTAEFLAKLRGDSLENLASVTSANSASLFGLSEEKLST